MALITLLTDSGDKDFYVAAIKARIMSTNPGIRVEDISHHVGHGNIAHAAFVLSAVFRDFPKGTVHLVGVDSTGLQGNGYIAMQVEDHFFVASNCGVLSLLSPKTPQQLVELQGFGTSVTTFPEKDILAPVAARIASGVALSDMGRHCQDFRRLTIRQPKANKQQILGHVIHIDHFGNLITNIEQRVFADLSPGRTFTVQFGGERVRSIQADYTQTEPGEVLVLFNSIGVMEIAVIKGNASALFGLTIDSPVNIIFD